MTIRIIFACFSLLLAHNVIAVETLSTEELASHCEHFADDPEGKDAIFCVRYIQGFIDGAIATDERVARNVAAEYEQKETFSERAMRTRSPSRLARYGPTVYADFCLGAPVPLREVVENVIEDLARGKSAIEESDARDSVFRVLREAYPCESEEQ